MIPFEFERNAESRVVFPTTLSGAFVTGHSWGGNDTVVRSLDGGAFSAATNSPAEIASSSGVHSLVLTSAECAADALAVKITNSLAAYDEIALLGFASRHRFVGRIVQLFIPGLLSSR